MRYKTLYGLIMMLYTALQVCQIRCKDRLYDDGVVINKKCYCANKLNEKEQIPIKISTIPEKKKVNKSEQFDSWD